MARFNIKPENKLAPATGRILIAEPFMEDNYFQRTVVLLCAHDDEGSFGFILNRYMDVELSDIVDQLPSIKSKVGMGGPVLNSNLYYIHTLGHRLEGSMKIGNNLYAGGDFTQLKILIDQKEIDPTKIRFFVGYSGWDADQLEQELEEDSWYISNLGDLPIFDTEKDDFWEQALRNMGGDFANLAHFPVDPNLN